MESFIIFLLIAGTFLSCLVIERGFLEHESSSDGLILMPFPTRQQIKWNGQL